MKKSADTPRIKTDTLFCLDPGSFDYTGTVIDALHFLEDLQLKDANLWKKFVEQYAGEPDTVNHGWRCEYWGKTMRGACFTYAYTKSAELYSAMENTVRDLLKTQDSLGRFSTYNLETEFTGWDIWGRKYILLGFQYFYEICNDEKLCSEILTAMCRHLDYIMSKIGPEESGKTPITKATNNWKGLNSSSLLEPVVRLYTLTEDKKYLDFASYIVENGGIEDDNIFEMAYEGKIYPYEYPVTKAYEMMSCFEGLLEYYRVTGIEKWKKAVQNFVRLVMKSDVTVIGCCGCTHELFDNSTVTQTDPERNIKTHMQETCVTVTWMKICNQLLCLDGESVFADCIETSTYNALLGTMNYDHHTSSVIRILKYINYSEEQIKMFDLNRFILPVDSYSPLLPNIRGKFVGGFNIMSEHTYYGCCAAIVGAATGLFPCTSVMRRKDGLAVNQYLNGKANAVLPDGAPVEIVMNTKYPYEPVVDISVNPKNSSRFALAFRIPSWSEKTELTVNGEKTEATAGNYAVIDREWSAGDTVKITFDFRIMPVRQDGYVSLRRGPIVLAADARLGRDVEDAVSVAENSDGSVKASCADAPFKHKEAFLIEGTDGSTFNVVDYASAGTTWDEDSKMAAWLKEKSK